MVNKDKVSKTISLEELEKLAKIEKLENDKKIRRGELFEQPPSDSEHDICGPLHCDKEL